EEAGSPAVVEYVTLRKIEQELEPEEPAPQKPEPKTYPALKPGDRVITRTGHEGMIQRFKGRFAEVETRNGIRDHDVSTLTLKEIPGKTIEERMVNMLTGEPHVTGATKVLDALQLIFRETDSGEVNEVGMPVARIMS